MNNVNLNEKLILPISIILVSIVLGGFYYASQITKQNSIERQKQMEIDQEKMKLDAEREKVKKEDLARKECYSQAEKSATALLKTKSEIDKNNNIWKEASEKDLYLKDDFDKSYDDCLSSHGLKR